MSRHGWIEGLHLRLEWGILKTIKTFTTGSLVLKTSLIGCFLTWTIFELVTVLLARSCLILTTNEVFPCSKMTNFCQTMIISFQVAFVFLRVLHLSISLTPTEYFSSIFSCQQ